MAIDNLNGPLRLSKGKIQHSTLIAVVCLLLLSSCSLQKRLYNKGFYASKTHSPKKELRKQSNDTLLTHLASAKSIEMKETPAPLSIEASAKKGMITYIAPAIIDTTSRCDTLILKNGTVILTKISEVYPDRITYRFCNAPDEPLRTINKTDLRRIIYANGSKEAIAANCDNITLKNGTIIPAKIVSIYTGKIKFRPCPDNGGTISTVNKDDVAQVIYTDETIKMLRKSGSDFYGPLLTTSLSEPNSIIELTTNGFAVAGFVLSLLSIPLSLVLAILIRVVFSTGSVGVNVIYFFPFIIPILAIIFCIVALVQISKNKDMQRGLGLAVAGLVIALILSASLLAILIAF